MPVHKTQENRRPAWCLPAIVLACLSVTSAFGQSTKQKPRNAETAETAEIKSVELKAGDLAPAFELKGLDDKTVTLKDFRQSETSKGKNVVVVFVRAYW